MYSFHSKDEPSQNQIVGGFLLKYSSKSIRLFHIMIELSPSLVLDTLKL